MLREADLFFLTIVSASKALSLRTSSVDCRRCTHSETFTLEKVGLVQPLKRISRMDLRDLPKTTSAGEISVDLQGILRIVERVTGKKETQSKQESHALERIGLSGS